MDTHTIVLIGLGGVVGAISRYLLSGWVQNNYLGFPYGTLSVNFTGTLTLSIVMYLSEYTAAVPSDVRVLLTVGVLSAYTTMSTFGFESFRLLEQGETLRFTLNFLATNALVLFAVWLGKLVAVRLSGVRI